ncbi:uncharacterized protein, partial [Hoplias malabaricus]|uniref:uncharacterized protein n=1 Tax=Hoplias malabaricus TaxID=27720 RepID=UPI003462C5BA
IKEREEKEGEGEKEQTKERKKEEREKGGYLHTPLKRVPGDQRRLNHTFLSELPSLGCDRCIIRCQTWKEREIERERREREIEREMREKEKDEK